jgi:D-alanyl-lipoteichoic acid acyltransferase DltB (MBOAT superfamily)
MPFNSFQFLFVFLPLTLIAVYTARLVANPRYIVVILIIASLIFYAQSSVLYLGLFLALMLVNYACARAIAAQGTERPAKRALLILGCTTNVLVLVYFKYRGFVAANLNEAFGAGFKLESFVIPLGISFFIFQKIAFLADAYEGKIKKFDLPDYLLFVSFFPQLIAGPIVHYGDMQPQFDRTPWASIKAADFVKAISFITIGLFKKVALADNVAQYADIAFNAAATGTVPTFADAWIGVLAFALQIYFDFSGYSDMAIGLAALFGVRLPVNFASPYKSLSVIEFWRRWHITLSQFLRDYLYVPLGGNRKGERRRYFNIIITMSLGGLWHGAAWTFVAWGILHGAFLIANHAWRTLCTRAPKMARLNASPAMVPISWALTFVAVAFAWCLFRAPSFEAAMKIAGAMAYAASDGTAAFGWHETFFIAAGLGWVMFLPNSQQFVDHLLIQDGLPLALVGAGQSLLFLSSLYFIMVHQYEKFIYFMF